MDWKGNRGQGKMRHKEPVAKGLHCWWREVTDVPFGYRELWRDEGERARPSAQSLAATFQILKCQPGAEEPHNIPGRFRNMTSYLDGLSGC